MWKIYALLSAVFASLAAILAKIVGQAVDSNLAAAIRVPFAPILSRQH